MAKTTSLTITLYDVPANTNTAVMEWAVTDYRSAKLCIQGSSNSEHQMTELAVIHDNIYVYLRESNQSFTQDTFIQYYAKVDEANGNVIILANSTLPNTDFTIFGIMLEVINRSSADDTISQDKILDAATSMRGLYPEDSTDYVKAQTGSLYREDLIATMDREISDGLYTLNTPAFAALTLSEQEAYLNNLANVINTRSADLQTAIDADVNAIADVNNKIEAAGLVGGIQTAYKDPHAKALLDLTLNNTIKAAIS